MVFDSIFERILKYDEKSRGIFFEGKTRFLNKFLESFSRSDRKFLYINIFIGNLICNQKHESLKRFTKFLN